ncbi:hypothetical protein DYU11_10470 [Fibrisoma montanum]|uniref:Polysaccharide biosynthesis protein n=1 Tax=Fibrisoma montanum TaxID=2305895 RepID=A0A418MAP2_9BACT|nr:oligosaccharide flippase family protein [Fibrisoma montanum]RIV23419.1 hypothetical protein DYU11_10470 [Fibrisoma montanum]
MLAKMLQVGNLFLRIGRVDNKRTLIVYRNIIASVFLKGAGVLISFIMVPLTISYVNVQNFGIWMTISSITLWFGIIDVGFGNGLRNQLVVNFAQNDFDVAKRSLSTLYFILILSAIFLSCLCGILTNFINWVELFHIDKSEQPIIQHVILIVLTSFSIQIALKPINSVLLADQRSSMTSWILLSGNLLALFCVFVAVRFTSGSLLTLAYIQSCTPVISLVIANVWLFSTKYKHIAPSLSAVRLRNSKSLFGTGGQFLFLQISSVLMFSSGNIVVSYFLGSDQVTVYTVANRYFGVIPLLYGIIITPYWSAFTDAYAKQDKVWIINTMRKLNQFTLLVLVSVVSLLFFANKAYGYWVGEKIYIPFLLSISFACYVVSYTALGNYNYFINGIGKIRVLLLASIFGLILYIPLNYIFIKYLNLGISGVVWVSTLWNLILILLCRTQYKKIINDTASGLWNK